MEHRLFPSDLVVLAGDRWRASRSIQKMLEAVGPSLLPDADRKTSHGAVCGQSKSLPMMSRVVGRARWET
jgi:hypothetical protein